MKRIVTGSRAFFSGMEGFKPKDVDVVILVNAKNVPFQWMRQTSNGAVDVFEIVRHPKEELIAHAVRKARPMAIARFLTPDFAKAIGLLPSDLPALKPMRDALDPKHGYLGVIYDAYLENGSFTLTEAQRMAAFENYKAAREKKPEKPKGSEYSQRKIVLPLQRVTK